MTRVQEGDYRERERERESFVAASLAKKRERGEIQQCSFQRDGMSKLGKMCVPIGKVILVVSNS